MEKCRCIKLKALRIKLSSSVPFIIPPVLSLPQKVFTHLCKNKIQLGKFNDKITNLIKCRNIKNIFLKTFII